MVIGDGKTAADAAVVVAGTSGVEAVAWLHHSDDAWSAAMAGKLGKNHPVIGIEACQHVSDASARAALDTFAPHLMLSANNFDIIPGALIASLPDGAINFHNGPLPDYRGVNIPSWAIINGERQHGVVWHRVDAGIDTGAVLARAAFEMAADETAATLTMRCIQQGLALLPALITRYCDGCLREEPRPARPGRLYRRHDTPAEGIVNPEWPPERIDALLRGLNFRPFPNPFVKPGVRLPDGAVTRGEYGEFRAEAGIAPPGTILEETAESLRIACRGGSLRLHELNHATAPDVRV